jgi:hypothetical protein
MATFTALIAASADDAQEVAGTVTTNDLTISSDATTDFGGARFLNVTIPRGSTITSAYLTVEPSASTEDEPSHTFYCQAADNAGTFTTGASDISARTRTTRSVLWDSADLGADGNTRHNTPDLSGIVGEVISRPGWVSGNALVFIWHGAADALRDLTIKSFDTGASDGPELTITYLPPGWVGGLSHGPKSKAITAPTDAVERQLGRLLNGKKKPTVGRRRGVIR